jgi:thioredoxin 1
MASELIKHVSDASFETDVLKADQPVLVDYWAEWCGPCKMIAPILDEVATGYQGKLQIAKMNVDENRDIPAKFGIRGIPTLMLFKDVYEKTPTARTSRFGFRSRTPRPGQTPRLVSAFAPRSVPLPRFLSSVVELHPSGVHPCTSTNSRPCTFPKS